MRVLNGSLWLPEQQINKTLTDDERRKNAEEMIKKIARLMDIGEGEEDDFLDESDGEKLPDSY